MSPVGSEEVLFLLERPDLRVVSPRFQWRARRTKLLFQVGRLAGVTFCAHVVALLACLGPTGPTLRGCRDMTVLQWADVETGMRSLWGASSGQPEGHM
jgi:hypothetical protein